MAKNVVVKPLGLVLRKAGLVSSKQVEKALKESLSLPQCKIGEILAIRGWIKPQTADFFAEVWPKILATKQLQPLGQYLKAASLMNEQQIAQVLQIQQQNYLKFGKIAVEQKIISQATLDFFLEHLKLIKAEETISIYPEAVALELDRIENYILNNQKCEPTRLLQKYDEIRKQGTIIAKGDVSEQELVASGIVIIDKNLIRIAQASYAHNFGEDWIEQKLAELKPYNQIRLKMFDLQNKSELPYKVISAVNNWTENQPLLTQKIYQLIKEKSTYIAPGKEEIVVEELAYQHIINNWQTGAAAKHLQAISDRILNNQACSIKKLLNAYKKVWQLKEVNADGSLEQQQLLQLGLIKLKNHRISVSNLIYQAVFDLKWIEDNLITLKQPSSIEETTFSNNNVSLISQEFASPKFRKPLFILGIIAPLAATSFVINVFKQPLQANRLLEQGNDFLAQQKYHKALTTYDKLIEVQYNNQADKNNLSVAYELRGQVLQQLKQHNQAIANYEQALVYNSQSISAKQNMALSLSNLGQETKANTIFETLLQQPNLTTQERSKTWWYWGKHFCLQNNLKLANYAFSKALVVSPEYEAEIKLDRDRCQ